MGQLDVFAPNILNMGSSTHSFPLLLGTGRSSRKSGTANFVPKRPPSHFPNVIEHFSSHFYRNYLISLITDMGTSLPLASNCLNFVLHTLNFQPTMLLTPVSSDTFLKPFIDHCRHFIITHFSPNVYNHQRNRFKLSLKLTL